jgi:autotransporter strand-loop-strand O-heptosyltransferase
MSEIINIRFDAFGLGDNIAFIPYVEEYRKQFEKTVIVSTFYNNLFYKEYPELIFVEPNNLIHNVEKILIGVNVNGGERGLKNWQSLPLQQIPCEILGLDYEPIQPKVSYANVDIPFDKYICISEFSTRKMKEWNNPNGWQEVVDYCTLKGVKVVACSKEKTHLKGVIDCTGDRPLLNRAKLLKDAIGFIGVSSGLAWMSWAVDTPVIMISGCTMDWHEFPCHRIINKDVCHGCINKREMKNEMECLNENTHVCTRKITSDVIINTLEEIV